MRGKFKFLPMASAVFAMLGVTYFAGSVIANDATGPDNVHPLIAGCEGIPEAIALNERLLLRGDRVETYLAELDRKRAELKEVEIQLVARLSELRTASPSLAARQTVRASAVEEDIGRMVAIYDVMKPTDAAGVLTKLPPDYAAEILMRVGAETGARIIAALEPETAAVLTAHMGARNLGHN